jgi:hypothetical protein
MNRNLDKTNLQNRQSFVECPTCGFIRNVTPAKHKDPSWDSKCNRCVKEEQLMQDYPIGSKFGSWTVLDHQLLRQTNETLINVECECGMKTAVQPWTLSAKKSKSCSKCAYKKAFKGYEQISLTYYKQLKSAAKRRGHVFEIGIEYMWDVFEKQEGRCHFTGLDLLLTNSNHFKSQTASLDRIDSKQGYIEGNVQWVHKDANKLKMDLPEEDFFRIIKQIYEHKQLNK